MEGERSGLFFEIVRLAKEIKPKFIFLENVPAITSRGGLQVVREIAAVGYDCRWCVVSAASVGALHRRERWFLLAYSKHNGTSTSKKRESSGKSTASRQQQQSKEDIGKIERASSLCGNVAQQPMSICSSRKTRRDDKSEYWPFESRNDWQKTVSEMGKRSDGLPHQVDRLKALGNAVVPIQVRQAFKILFGLYAH